MRSTGYDSSPPEASKLEGVISVIRRLPDKWSAADLTPTPVLKQVADLTKPFTVEVFNLSPAAELSCRIREGAQNINVGTRPHRRQFVLIVLETVGAVEGDEMPRCPLSLEYRISADLLPPPQSGFLPRHSTEPSLEGAFRLHTRCR